MPNSIYYMTDTAREHLKKAVRETQQKWGARQMKKYTANFLAGLQNMADNHQRLQTPHRAALAEGTDFLLHLIEHRYIAYQEHDKNTLIIAGIFHATIFHASMDIPARLRELKTMAQHEILALKREIAHREGQR